MGEVLIYAKQHGGAGTDAGRGNVAANLKAMFGAVTPSKLRKMREERRAASAAKAERRKARAEARRAARR